MDEDVPDGGDIAEFDIDGAEEESDTEGKEVELDDGGDGKKPSPGWLDAIDESENDDDDEVNQHVDDGGEGGGDNNDVFGEADFAEEVAARNDGLDALGSALSKKRPHGCTAEKVNWIMGDVVADFEEFRKNDIHDSEHHKGAKECPKIAQD